MPLKLHGLQIAVYVTILVVRVCVCRLLGSEHNQLKYGTNLMLKQTKGVILYPW